MNGSHGVWWVYLQLRIRTKRHLGLVTLCPFRERTCLFGVGLPNQPESGDTQKRTELHTGSWGLVCLQFLIQEKPCNRHWFAGDI